MMGDHEEDSRASVPVSLGQGRNPPHPLDGEWYINIDSETYGPYSGHRIKQMIADGRVRADTDVIRVGANDWTDAGDDRALRSLFPGSRPALKDRGERDGFVAAGTGATVVQVTNQLGRDRPQNVMIEDGRAAPKSAGTALVLSILIVGLGQIYNGQVGKGIFMFVACIALWFALLGWIINIWSWIDAYQTASQMNQRYQRRLAAGIVV